MKCLTKGTFVGMYTNLLYLQSTAEKKHFEIYLSKIVCT